MSTVVLQQQARRTAASPLLADLKRALDRARSRIGDPYVWGGKVPPTTDCSGFVAWAYEDKVRSFTDWIFDDTVPAPSSLPGDIVLYEYDDPDQTGVRFPHCGLWLSDTLTLDNRYPQGVGIHPHVIGATRYVRRVPGLEASPVTYFTPEQIAAVLSSPVANVRQQWPLVLAALHEQGIADEPVQIAALGTIGVEAQVFLPVEEGYYLGAGADVYRQTRWYAPFWGRGLVQLSTEANYRAAEQALGIAGLHDHPELALDPHNSARIFAWFFATTGIAPLARTGQWVAVRRKVNGGSAGLADFLGYVKALQQVRHGG